MHNSTTIFTRYIFYIYSKLHR